MTETMRSAPRYSVIIPTLNEADYIPLLLSDFQKQLFHSFEVIIVDGKSTDGTLEEIEKYRHSLNLRLLTAKKKNVSYQRNFGAENARGEFLIFIDADCRIPSNFMKKLDNDVNKYKYLLYMPAMLPEKKKYMHETYTVLTNFITEVSHIIGRPFATSSTLIIEKNFFNFIGKYDEKMTIYEDQEIIQRAFKSGINAKLLKDIGVVFCFRRFEKEGTFEIYKKYLIASAYILAKGKIYENIVDYKMEGGAYHKIEPSKTKRYDEALKKAVVSVKKMAEAVNAGLK
jgi:glycosyltransferase involved in cell wall biosynthesis